MRWLLLLLLGVGCCSGDPDLRQLLQVWRPHLTVPWRNVTPQCASAMEEYSQALQNHEQWASAMLDATGQAVSQYLKGSDFWLGSRLQCDKVEVEFQRNETTEFPIAVYRLAYLRFNISSSIVVPQITNYGMLSKPRLIKLGVCLPGACGDPEQVRSLLEQMLEAAQEEQRYRDVTVTRVKNIPGDSILANTSTILLILVSCIVVLLAGLGTGVDLLQSQDILKQEHGDVWQKVFLAFSVRQNARKLFDVSPGPEGNLPSVNGIRALGIIWINYVHFVIFYLSFGESPSYQREIESRIDYQLIVNGHFSVDAFFFMSGVLMSYILLRTEMRKKQTTFLGVVRRFYHIIKHRILRLIMPYMYSILVYLVVTTYYTNHSPFEVSIFDYEKCSTNWWRNLLFISNFFPFSDQCAIYGWYLSVDTQLYILATVLLLVYVNGYPRTAVAAGVAILVSAWLATAGVSYSLDFIPGGDDALQNFDELQDKPWNRMGAFWVGILTGWLLRRKKYNFNKLHVTVGWCLFVLVSSGTIFVMHWRDWFNVTGTSVYVALASTLWALSLSWVLIACDSKNAGWAGDFLESPWLAFLSRCTYCAYLLNIPMYSFILLSLEGPVPVTREFGAVLVLGFSTVNFTLAAVLSLLIEIPVTRLLTLSRTISREKYKKAIIKTEPTTVNHQTEI